MDIRQLRYFLAILEQGSLSRAAEVLHVAQPALSLHLRNMEADLGCALLQRSPRGVRPTEEGLLLAGHARRILDQLAQARAEIRGLEAAPSGEVRIGLPGTIAEILAVPLIAEARRRYPGIRLKVAEAMSGFVREWLLAGRVDLAVLYGPETGSTNRQAAQGARRGAIRGLVSRPLLEEALIAFAAPSAAAGLPPPGTPLGLPLLAARAVILPGEGHGLRDLLSEAAQQAGCRIAPVIEVDSYAHIKALVLEGHGCSVLPGHAVAPERAAERLRAWPLHGGAKGEGAPLRRQVQLAHPAERPLPHAARVIHELAAQIMLGFARDGRWTGVRELELGGDQDPDQESDQDPGRV